MNLDVASELPVKLTDAVTSIQSAIIAQKEGHPYLEDFRKPTVQLLSIAEDLYYESLMNFSEFRPEVAEIYNKKILDLLRKGVDRLNDLVGYLDGDFKNRVSRLPETIEQLLPIENATTIQDYAIQVNRMFIYLSSRLFDYFPAADEEVVINTGGTALQVLVIYHTGVYDFLFAQYNKNQTKVSEAIAHIIGSNPNTIRRFFPFLVKPMLDNKNNPYLNEKITSQLLNKLASLKVDTTTLEDTLKKILIRTEKNRIKK